MHASLIHLAPFAAILAVLYVGLATHIIRFRYRHQLTLGTANDDAMQRAVRAHANFAEYTPFALLMIALVSLLGGSSMLVTLLGLMLVVARIAHAYSLLVHEPTYGAYRWRTMGMIGSFAVLLVAAVFLLWQWLVLST